MFRHQTLEHLGELHGIGQIRDSIIGLVEGDDFRQRFFHYSDMPAEIG